MKIVLVNYRYFFSGGPERYMFNIKQLLEEEGHDYYTVKCLVKLNISPDTLLNIFAYICKKNQ